MLCQIHNRHQRNTDDDEQAIGEELRYVQMSRWSMHIGEKEVSNNNRDLAQSAMH